MDPSLLLLVGIATAAFVGVNIGGASTGVAFGPATGSGAISMRRASALMAVFVLLGGATVGTNVVRTLGEGFVPPEFFTPRASIAVLAFIGLGILLGNVVRVSVGTSQAAVLGVAGMGAALGVLDWSTFGEVVMWWFVSAILAFWFCAFVGRYFYDRLVRSLDVDPDDPGWGMRLLVIGIGCYMAFSAGASNVANAVAPLVGSGQIGMTRGVALGGIAIGAGAFWIGPRTMETVGTEITDLTLEAALVVETVAASIIVGLSAAGIPASLAVTLTCCVIGLGWGRASRRIPLGALVHPGGLSVRNQEDWVADQLELYDPTTTRRILVTWIASPTLAGAAAYGAFFLARQLGLIVVS